MENKRVPAFNDSFDINTLLFIIKKYWVLYIIFFGICLSIACLYLRYTPKIYESSSVIQINQEANHPFDEQSYERLYGNSSLENLIELIRSKEFLKTVAPKLPLEISYFSEGTFLDFELYKNAPFFVEIDKTNIFLFDIPFHVQFINNKEFVLTYTSGNILRKHTLTTNKWNEVDGMRLYLNVSNFQKIAAPRFSSAKAPAG